MQACLIAAGFIFWAAAPVWSQVSPDVPPYPAPGKFFDVGGWRLHLNCTGAAKSNEPTVILEPGIGDFSVEWSLVQPKVAAFARVCSYDRAGDGWSEVGPYPRTMRQITYELHTLLDKAGVAPPFVLVGHSYGAWLVRVYTATYPSEVAGIVLVDGGFDNPWRLLGDGKLVRAAEISGSRTIPAVKTSNPLRESDIPPGAFSQMKSAAAKDAARANEGPRGKLPAEAQRMRSWALGRWQHIAAAVNPFEAEELAALRGERLKNAQLLGDLPLVVLTRGVPESDERDGTGEERKKEQAELAAMSRNGKQIIAIKSGHHIQLEDPELVVTHIRNVLAASKK
jgi:pimeloyl-ACP methyl ester carboxylesterase